MEISKARIWTQVCLSYYMPSYHGAVMSPVKHYKNAVEDTRKYMLTMEL